MPHNRDMIADARWEILDGVKFDGRPVRALYDLWEPEMSVSLLPNVTCVMLRDADSGRNGVWYLDADRNYLGQHIEILEHVRTDDVLAPLHPALAELSQYSLVGRPQLAVALAPELPMFLAAQLTGAWVARHLASTSVVPISRPEADGTLSGPAGIVVDERNVRRLLDSRVTSGPFVVSSPFDGAPLRAQISFVSSGLAIYRFYALTQDTAFYLAWPERQREQRPEFYCPRAQLIVSDNPEAALLPSHILAWYITHPNHVRDIEEAETFEAKDYGLGRASNLVNLEAPSKDESRDPNEPIPARADAWSFLTAAAEGRSSNPIPTIEGTSLDAPQNAGLFGRLRGFIGRK